MFPTSSFKLLAVAVALTGLSGLGSAASATARAPSVTPGFPVVVDAANGRVTIRSRPTAIVSLSPTATEMLYAIGAGPQVKAVDNYSDYPKGTPMTNLNANSPNVEAIARYRPDLVVLAGDSPALNASFRELHMNVLSEPAAADLADEYEQFIELGEATGHVAAAEAEVAKIKGAIASIVRSIPRSSRPLSYYYELDQTYYSVTSSTFVGQVLGLLNLKSIADVAAAASSGYPQLSNEYIVKANPDYIFLADASCCGQSATTVAKRPAWSVLAAVRLHRILGLNGDIASRWGPRIVNLLRDVANELREHPISTRPST